MTLIEVYMQQQQQQQQKQHHNFIYTRSIGACAPSMYSECVKLTNNI